MKKTLTMGTKTAGLNPRTVRLWRSQQILHGNPSRPFIRLIPSTIDLNLRTHKDTLTFVVLTFFASSLRQSIRFNLLRQISNTNSSFRQQSRQLYTFSAFLYVFASYITPFIPSIMPHVRCTIRETTGGFHHLLHQFVLRAHSRKR